MTATAAASAAIGTPQQLTSRQGRAIELGGLLGLKNGRSRSVAPPAGPEAVQRKYSNATDCERLHQTAADH
jgi:hypothetical protein